MNIIRYRTWVFLMSGSVSNRLRPSCDELGQLLQLGFGHLDEWRPDRARRPAYGFHPCFDQGDGVSFAAVADLDERQDKLAQAGEDPCMIAPANSGVEVEREVGQEVEDS